MNCNNKVEHNKNMNMLNSSKWKIRRTFSSITAIKTRTCLNIFLVVGTDRVNWSLVAFKGVLFCSSSSIPNLKLIKGVRKEWERLIQLINMLNHVPLWVNKQVKNLDGLIITACNNTKLLVRVRECQVINSTNVCINLCIWIYTRCQCWEAEKIDPERLTIWNHT